MPQSFHYNNDHCTYSLLFKCTILTKSAQIIFTYSRCWFGYAFNHLWFNKVNKTCVIGVLSKNIINTLSGSYFVDKIAACVCLYRQTINIKWLFVHMSGNKQSIWKWLVSNYSHWDKDVWDEEAKLAYVSHPTQKHM